MDGAQTARRASYPPRFDPHLRRRRKYLPGSGGLRKRRRGATKGHAPCAGTEKILFLKVDTSRHWRLFRCLRKEVKHRETVSRRGGKYDERPGLILRWYGPREARVSSSYFFCNHTVPRRVPSPLPPAPPAAPPLSVTQPCAKIRHRVRNTPANEGFSLRVLSSLPRSYRIAGLQQLC